MIEVWRKPSIDTTDKSRVCREHGRADCPDCLSALNERLKNEPHFQSSAPGRATRIVNWIASGCMGVRPAIIRRGDHVGGFSFLEPHHQGVD